MENVISCKNLTHYYGKRLIYKDLSFNVPKGRILGLLGKNGTGKTTTINILNGYLKPKSGECLIFGRDVQNMEPSLRRNIGLLIEGHIQYSFMNIRQIEKFYASFYPKWKKEAFYELVGKLKITPTQRISRMSCGQRSQIALGLILAQDPELLILDDFSLGLDPGYRRLFVDYLREYARAEKVTAVWHIIQDMERLIDDCIIMDYGRIMIQQPVKELLGSVKRYEFTVPDRYEPNGYSGFYYPSKIRNHVETFSFFSEKEAEEKLKSLGVPFSGLKAESVNLEDAFIGLTGKY